MMMQHKRSLEEENSTWMRTKKRTMSKVRDNNCNTSVTEEPTILQLFDLPLDGLCHILEFVPVVDLLRLRLLSVHVRKACFPNLFF